MRKRCRVLWGVIVAGVLAAGVLGVFHPRGRLVSRKAAAFRRDIVDSPAHARLVRKSAHAGTAPSVSAVPMTEDELQRFRLFQRDALVFNGTIAKDLELTPDQQAAIWVVAWNCRSKLNQWIGEHALISRPSDREVVLAFKLPSVEVADLRRELYDGVRDAVGAATWPAVCRTALMKQLEQAMDYWGESETAYSIKPVQLTSGTTMVTMEVVRAAAMPVTISRQYRLGVFKAIYGPVADRAGL